jgi:hypothetical protein
MAWLPANPDAIFIKHVHNAMLDSGLQPWLAERGIGKLLVSGIRTEQCCETTTRVASDLGLRWILSAKPRSPLPCAIRSAASCSVQTKSGKNRAGAG